MLYRVRRSMAFCDRYCCGLEIEKGLKPLFLNFIIYLLYWALANCPHKTITTAHNIHFFIASVIIDDGSLYTKSYISISSPVQVWLVLQHCKFLVDHSNALRVFFN